MVCTKCELPEVDFSSSIRSLCKAVFSRLKGPLLIILALGSTAIAVHYWLEVAEIQNALAALEEARQEELFATCKLRRQLMKYKENCGRGKWSFTAMEPSSRIQEQYPNYRRRQQQQHQQQQQQHQQQQQNYLQDCSNRSTTPSMQFLQQQFQQKQQQDQQQRASNVAIPEVCQKKLYQEMKNLMEKEKRSTAEVECLAKELDELRDKIQQTYVESNEYVRTMRIWTNSHQDLY